MWIPIVLLLVSCCWGCAPGALDQKGGFFHGPGLDGVRIDLNVPPTRVLPVTIQAAEFAVALIPRESLAGLPDSAFGMHSRLGNRAVWGTKAILNAYRFDDVMALKPDLVITGVEKSGQVTDRLRNKGIPVLCLPRVCRFEDIEESMGFMGRLLDAEARADQLLQSMDLRRQALRQRSVSWRGASGLLYLRDESDAWTQGLQSSADVLLELVGLSNAAGLGELRGDYRIDNERLLALDPDVIVYQSEGSDSGANQLLDSPALQGLAAVRAGRVLVLPLDLFQTSSLRIMDAAEELTWQIEESGLGSG